MGCLRSQPQGAVSSGIPTLAQATEAQGAAGELETARRRLQWMWLTVPGSSAAIGVETESLEDRPVQMHEEEVEATSWETTFLLQP